LKPYAATAPSRAASPRPGPGRPAVLACAERRALLLDAAAKIFLDHGYTSATMHAIAVEARMSKKTLYQVFPSKMALFDALLADRIYIMSGPPDCAGCDPRESLTRVVLAIADILLLPDRLGLLRLIIAESAASPELATAFERLRLSHDLNAIELWIAKAQAAGLLRPGDVGDYARLLFGMSIAEPVLQTLINAPPKGSDATVDARVRAAVDIFLRGLAPDSDHP
jgi:AcrR family transcriptional regulator